MLSQQAFARKLILKKIFISTTKFFSFYKNVVFHTTSQQEFNDVTTLFPQNKIYLIPNLTRKIQQINLNPKEKLSGTLKLVSIARISQEKNTKFALEVLSKIKQGKVIFDIYGGIYDKQYWQECQEIYKNFTNVQLNYCGTLETENVIETFAKYHFAFMPSKAENFGHSIVESLLAATPVIISNTTPWQNLQSYGVGWDISLDNIDKFVEIIKICIDMNQNQYYQMQKMCNIYVQNYLKNNTDINKYIEMFENEAK